MRREAAFLLKGGADVESILEPSPSRRRGGVNWNMVGAILTALALLGGWLMGAFGDYRSIGERVTTLEVQRVEDVKKAEKQREEDAHWRERIENKVDLLLQRR